MPHWSAAAMVTPIFMPRRPSQRKNETAASAHQGPQIAKASTTGGPQEIALRQAQGNGELVEPLVPATVSWYGGLDRKVELTGNTGWWYKAGKGLVPVRWVFVHDVQGTHRGAGIDIRYRLSYNLNNLTFVITLGERL